MGVAIRRLFWLLGVAGLSLTPACSSRSVNPASTCAPNEQQSCSCDGGLSGSQVCDEAGNGFSACDCSGGAGGAGGTAGAGGAGGGSCQAEAFYCSGAALEQCDADGVARTVVETCASAVLCERGKASGVCTPPACGPGASDPTLDRCREGDRETCAADRQGFEQTSCAGAHCNPREGAGCFALEVDAREVSVQDYSAFLQVVSSGGFSLTDLPAACSFETGFQPDPNCLGALGADSCQGSSCPQTCVSWCDAWAYCEQRGQRLCGSLIDGGMLQPSQFADPGLSEWSNACSSGGQYEFPYGTFAPGTCNGLGHTGFTGPTTPDQLGDCVSPVAAYAPFVNLSGNVAEWENACAATAEAGGRSDGCQVRGGSYAGAQSELGCAADRQVARDTVAPDIGFRCCGTGN